MSSPQYCLCSADAESSACSMSAACISFLSCLCCVSCSSLPSSHFSLFLSSPFCLSLHDVYQPALPLCSFCLPLTTSGRCPVLFFPPENCHLMPLDLSNYKARVGEFYTRAVWLSCITTHNILPFFVLLFRRHSGLPLALLLFLLPPPQLNLSLQADMTNLSTQTQCACRRCKHSVEILSSSIPCSIPAGCALCLFPI